MTGQTIEASGGYKLWPHRKIQGKHRSDAIIGFGKIGHALAKAFACNGIEVSVATTRDPESFASDAAVIGPRSFPRV